TTIIPTTIYELSTWAEWEEWSMCSKSCGGGLSYRKRSCLTTAYSKQCYGHSKQKRVCNRASCEVFTTQEPTTSTTIGYGRWTKWTPWSQCSSSCGRGMRERMRRCKKNSKYDRNCIGRKTDREACNQHTWCSTTSTTTTTTTAPAPYWSRWSLWTSCTQTCGYGKKTRKRTCIDSSYSGQSCYGKRAQSRYCNAFPCTTTYVSTTTKKPSEWSYWSIWSSCTKTCNVGTRSRTRYCKGSYCSGPKNQQQKCGWKMCPTYPPQTTTTEDPYNPPDSPKYSSWTYWSTCSRSCGGGSQYRTRKCKAGYCLGTLRQNKSCNRTPCTTTSTTTTTTTTTTTPDYWGPWGSWGECLQTINGGRRYRERDCLGYSNRCSGKRKESKKCTIITTTTSTTTTTTYPSSRWGEWSNWSDCSKSCEGGVSERTRKCFGHYKNCNGQKRQTKMCNRYLCPTSPPPTTTENPDYESQWSKWSEWGACSKTCGYGRTIRSRECNPDCYGNKNCPGSKNQKKSCMVIESCYTTTTSTTLTSTTTTVIQCVGAWSDWSEWGSCSATCDGGIMEKTRVCKDKNSGHDSYSGSLNYRKRRSIHEDFPHGPHSPGEISGSNNHSGNKNSENSNNGGHDNSGGNINSGNNTNENSHNSENTNQGGHNSSGNNNNSGINGLENNNSVPSDCKCKDPNKRPAWGQWEHWRECSVTCGSGKQTRTRECFEYNKPTDPSKCGAEDLYFETKSCDAGKCSGGGYDMFGWTQWGKWSKCPESCEGGIKSRTRTCRTYNCTGKDKEIVKCSVLDCENDYDSETGWAQWGEWGACTAICGKGKQYRERECIVNNYSNNNNGANCQGSNSESRTCTASQICSSNNINNYNYKPQSNWGPWEPWNRCSKTCGEGSQQRYRECYGDYCSGKQAETKKCYAGDCYGSYGYQRSAGPGWSGWSFWSPCSMTCAGGTRTKQRVCRSELSCPGESEETEECNVGIVCTGTFGFAMGDTGGMQFDMGINSVPQIAEIEECIAEFETESADYCSLRELTLGIEVEIESLRDAFSSIGDYENEFRASFEELLLEHNRLSVDPSACKTESDLFYTSQVGAECNLRSDNPGVLSEYLNIFQDNLISYHYSAFVNCEVSKKPLKLFKIFDTIRRLSFNLKQDIAYPMKVVGGFSIGERGLGEMEPKFESGTNSIPPGLTCDRDNKFQQFNNLIKTTSSLNALHPWHTELKVTSFDGSVHFCGGVIIDDEYILTTTEHCCLASTSQIEAMIGGAKWTEGADSSRGEFSVKSIFVKPRIDVTDACLVKIPSLFKSKPGACEFCFGKACLPLRSQKPEHGQYCWMKGSEMNPLAKVGVNIYSESYCSLSGYVPSGLVDFNREFCAGDIDLDNDGIYETAEGICTADRGSPLICNSPEGTATIFGLFARQTDVSSCSSSGYPAVFVDVSTITESLVKLMQTS
ncbi:unnamed protein product, partial [Oikopleura dioica]